MIEFQWQDSVYLKNDNEVRQFFRNHTEQLFVLGKGFDPRTCEGIKILSQLNEDIHILLINYFEKSTASSKQNEVKSTDNYKKLISLVKNDSFSEINIQMWKKELDNQRSITHESIRKSITKEVIEKYKEIIIDISAMPRTVSFNLIKRIKDIISKNQKLYIFVCENSDLDDKIDPIITAESAEYLQGFGTFSIGRESISDTTKVWLPILGFNELPALKKIEEFLKPNEICPVIPFPGLNAKRGENTIRYYGEFLFKALEVEKRNIIYVPESHPILTYLKLCNTVQYYENALNCEKDSIIRYIFSTQSSKLMDVGVLLAIMDLQNQGYTIGMAIVENEGYNVLGDYNEQNNKLSCICLNDKEFDW
jgi:hypothetical protein